MIKKILTPSLHKIVWKDQILRVIQASLDAVNPVKAIPAHFHRENTLLFAGERVFDLNRFQHIFLVGVGKASINMSSAITAEIGNYIKKGIVIVKKGYKVNQQFPNQITILESDHPLPDQNSIKVSRQVINLLQETSEKDLVIFVLSGGGSSLLTCPVEGISLEDIRQLTDLLLRSGAEIDEINAVRKHLDLVKGGRLISFAQNAFWISLILSDVIGDKLEVIGSGPTIPDPTTFRDALLILEKYQILQKVPQSIYSVLIMGIDGKIPETPKPNNPCFQNTYNILIGNNLQACQAAYDQAQKEGFNSMILTSYLHGEAKEVGKFISSIASQICLHNQPIPKPACIILGGETTVTVRGKGKGGRNQEIALSAVKGLSGLTSVVLITLATDGEDGPTDAAGAVVTGETFYRAIEKSLSPSSFLQNNDSYSFFNQLGDLLKMSYWNQRQ